MASLSMTDKPDEPFFALPKVRRGVKEHVSSSEWHARVELAALYRLMDHFKWTDFILNHISLRLPEEDAFLINPFGYLYHEITASSLVKIDIAGNILDDPSGIGFNPAGFIIHAAIHAARHDLLCVIHTHTKAGCAVAAHKAGLLPISQFAAGITYRLAYHAFEGIATRPDEQSRLVASLGDKPMMILRNHGLLAGGGSAAEAFANMYRLERACEVQVAALAGGVELEYCSAESLGEVEQVLGGGRRSYAKDWAAAMRLMHQVDPSFAQ